MKKLILTVALLILPRVVSGDFIGIASPTTYGTGPAPQGIFALGQTDDLTYEASDLNRSFIDGYAARCTWQHLDSGTADNSPVYDWTYIDNLFTTAATYGKKVTIYVWTAEPPAHVFVAHNGQAVDTYQPYISGAYRTCPVPWDQVALEDLARFYYDLANHQVSGTAVKNRPELVGVRTDFLGLKGLRDTDQIMVNDPAYSRSTFISAVLQSIHASVDVFNANTPIMLEVHNMYDATSDPRLDTATLSAILGEFGNRVTVFTENWNSVNPTGQTLTNHQQMMAGGSRSGYQAVGVFGTLSDANAAWNYGMSVGRPRYLEIYHSDITNTEIQPEFARWQWIVKTWSEAGAIYGVQ